MAGLLHRHGIFAPGGGGGGGGSISFIDSAGSIGAGSVGITAPAGRAVDDLLLVGVSDVGTGGAAVAAPSGWTALGEDSAGSNTARVHGYYRLADGTASDDFNVSGLYNNCNVSKMLVYRNVDATTPIDATSVTVSEGTPGKSVSIPGITTATDGALIVDFLAIRDNNEDPAATNVDLTLTRRFNDTTTFGFDCGLTGWDGAAGTAGAVAATNTTWTVQDETSAGIKIALRPA